MMMIIIIGKRAPFKPLFSLEDSAIICHQVFTSLDFATIIFLQNKVVSLAPNT
jgi:hypothetical protein